MVASRLWEQRGAVFSSGKADSHDRTVCHPAICCSHKASQLAGGPTAEHQVLYTVAVVAFVVTPLSAGAEVRAKTQPTRGQGALHIAPSLTTRESIGSVSKSAIGGGRA